MIRIMTNASEQVHNTHIGTAKSTKKAKAIES